jgi:hypothetical protein
VRRSTARMVRRGALPAPRDNMESERAEEAAEPAPAPQS